MKIGILTYHRSVNYGAFLQSYCLCTKLNSMPGLEAEIIDFTMLKEEQRRKVGVFTKNPIKMPYYYRLIKAFDKNSKLLPISKTRYVTDDGEEFRNAINGKYDVIVCGSDEIWNTNNFRGFPNPYWLVGDYGCKKVSYAASSRVNFVETPYREEVVKALDEFDYIGVRDTCTYDNIIKIHPQRVHLNCDPTFLNPILGDRENGERILHDRFHVRSNKKVIGLMCHDKDMANYIKKHFPEVELISLYEYDSKAHLNPSITPFEWVNVISALDFVVTHFFHCACFAITNNVPFYAVEIRKCQKEDSKVYDLLSRIGLEDRFSMGFNQAYSSGQIEDLMKKALFFNEKLDLSNKINEIQKYSSSFFDYIKGLY